MARAMRLDLWYNRDSAKTRPVGIACPDAGCRRSGFRWGGLKKQRLNGDPMSTTYVKMDSKRIEEVAGKDTSFKEDKLSSFIVAELVKTFHDKKKFAANIPPDALTDLLQNAVNLKIKESIKKMAKPITSIEVYTDTSTLTRESKLHMKHTAN